MSQSYIFLTQTKLEATKLNAVMYGFVHALEKHQTPKSIWDSWSAQNILEQEVLEYTKMLELGKVIVPQLSKKEELTNFASELYTAHNETLYCILGDLNELDESTQEGLLKILEEPPAQVIFLMYGTDTNILKPTIISRSSLVTLPTSIILTLLDPKLVEEVKKVLPEYKSVLHEILKSSPLMLRGLDYKKIERYHIDFWLWQVGYYAKILFNEQKLDLEYMSRIVNATTQAMKLNRSLVQKKFVVERLWL